MVISGCGDDLPRITHEQVLRWQDLSEQSLPLAQEITVNANDNVTMLGGSPSVTIEVAFANLDDLASSEQSVVDVARTVTSEAGGNPVTVAAYYKDVAGDEDEIADSILGKVASSGIGKVYVSASNYEYDSVSESLRSEWFVRVYVDDPSRVDPEWLAGVAEAADESLGDFRADVGYVEILPLSAEKISPGSEDFSSYVIDVRELDSFQEYGIDHECVRTGSWVFDVEYGYLQAYRADSPGGNCA